VQETGARRIFLQNQNYAQSQSSSDIAEHWESFISDMCSDMRRNYLQLLEYTKIAI
jgi:hypothetical protein